MTRIHKQVLLWLLAALFCCLLVLVVIGTGLSGKTLVTDPEGIPEAAEGVMNCIKTGDWPCLETLVLDTPPLTPATGAPGSPEAMLWEAYQESIRWSIPESFQVQNAAVTQAVSITCLDIPAVTHRIAGILADSQQQEIALQDAVNLALQDELPLLQKELTLTFQRKAGKWMLLPDSALKMLLSGFTAH